MQGTDAGPTSPLPGPSGVASASAASLSASGKRVLQLDVLRGVAILLVLGRHPAIMPDGAGLLKPLASVLLHIGWTGVDLFFVLSGFLVGGLLIGEYVSRGTLDVKRFMVRRGLKIWPPYVVFVAYLYCAVLWQELISGEGSVAHRAWRAVVHIAPNCLHVQNYLWTPRLHTWSLAVEEHFYLLLPLLVVLASRIARHRGIGVFARLLASACVLAIVADTLGRVFARDMYAVDQRPLYEWTHFRVDSLFCGVLLAAAVRFWPAVSRGAARHGSLLLLAGMLAVSPMLVLDLQADPFVATWGLTLVYLGYGLILLGTLCTPLGSGLVGRTCNTRLARWISFVGVHSYSIYLWHWDVGRLLVRWALSRVPLEASLGASWAWMVSGVAGAAASIAAGVLMAKIVEQPVLALRDRLLPSRAGGALDAVSAGVPQR